MIELTLKTQRRKINVTPEVSEGFKWPLVFYLSHKDDTRKMLWTFVVVDFPKQEALYIYSFLPENVEKIEKFVDKEKYYSASFLNPHCSLQDHPKESFYTFFEGSNYFYHVDYKRNILQIIHGSEVINVQNGIIRELGSTFYKDDRDSRYFYLSGEEKRDSDGKKKLHFMKMSLDRAEIIPIYQTPYHKDFKAPHVTRQFQDFLLNSEFSNYQYQQAKTGQIFNGVTDLKRYVYRELYEEYCHRSNILFSEEKFLSGDIVSPQMEFRSKEFENFCLIRGRNIFDICQNVEKLAIRGSLAGHISVLDMKNNELKRYQTTYCAPGHFEIDHNELTVYTSSHNFARDGLHHFFGPAALDKFVFQGDKLVRVATFSNPTGFRFTSHRVFYRNGRPYLCTIGHPNRLFIIDADTMQVDCVINLFEDILSDKIDVAAFLNNSDLFGKFVYIALEVSADGENILIIGYKNNYIFNITQKKMVAYIPHCLVDPWGGSPGEEKYYRTTAHVNYLT